MIIVSWGHPAASGWEQNVPAWVAAAIHRRTPLWKKRFLQEGLTSVFVAISQADNSGTLHVDARVERHDRQIDDGLAVID